MILLLVIQGKREVICNMIPTWRVNGLVIMEKNMEATIAYRV